VEEIYLDIYTTTCGLTPSKNISLEDGTDIAYLMGYFILLGFDLTSIELCVMIVIVSGNVIKKENNNL
jgi:hypothetical protein